MYISEVLKESRSRMRTLTTEGEK